MDATPCAAAAPADPDAAAAAFRAEAPRCRTYDEVIDAVERATAALGCDGLIYWSSPRVAVDARSHHDGFERETNLVTARGPTRLKALEALYLRRHGLVVDDPVVDRMLATDAPFTTEDAVAGLELTRRQRLALAITHRFGIHHDLVIPLHTPLRYQALYVFVLGKDAGLAERLRAARPALVRVAEVFAGAVADFAAPKRVADPGPVLSIREQECLLLMSRGMANPAIAAELGIAERTVKFHVDNLMRKLGASTRAQAVATAARSNWLTN